MKTQNIRYIIVHSTKSIPGEIPAQSEFNFLITSNGNIIDLVKRSPKAGCVTVGYAGGMNSCGQPCNTMNEKQAEKLFNLLVKLSNRYKRASIRGANELCRDPDDTGFDVKDWLKTFTPKVIRQCHPAAAA
jgi:hypothetical protein